MIGGARLPIAPHHKTLAAFFLTEISQLLMHRQQEYPQLNCGLVIGRHSLKLGMEF